MPAGLMQMIVLMGMELVAALVIVMVLKVMQVWCRSQWHVLKVGLGWKELLAHPHIVVPRCCHSWHIVIRQQVLTVGLIDGILHLEEGLLLDANVSSLGCDAHIVWNRKLIQNFLLFRS